MSAAVEPLQIVSERRYTAEVPVSQELVSPEDVYATTKEEEWIKKKKKELTTTRQIETRVKRQVTLEDGKVVDDTGPIVTTNTTEDTETQEHQQTEHRTTGDDPPEDGYVAVSRPEGLLKEIKEKKVTSHEEKEERLETENVEHMGDLCDKDYIAAIRQKQDVRAVLLANHDDGKKIVKKEPPRIIHQSSKSHKIIDSTDSHETKELHPDGKIVTETNKTTEREEIIERDDSDDGNDAIGEEKETTKESSQTVNKTKDEEFVEYFADGVKIGKEMRYSAEHTEVEKEGDRTMMDQDWDSLSTRIRKMRRQRAKLQNRGLQNGGEAVGGITALDRKDALTKKPVDFDEEEETRKLETNKWLEHHFGSESRSSKESLGENDLFPPTKNNTSFINVTMKSRPINGKTNAATSTSPVNGYSPGGHSSRVYVSSPEPQEISPANYRVTRVTPWSERHHNSIEEVTEYRTLQKPEKVQVYPSVTKDVTINRSTEKLRSQYSSSNGHLNRIPSEQRNGGIQYSMRNIPSPEYPNRNGTASPYTGKETPVNSSALSYNEEKCPSPPPRRKYQERMEMREEKFRSNLKSQNSYNSREAEREEIEPDEPAPDYSPTPPENRQNTPSPEIAPKKVYERTRFAADIPPVRRRSPPNQNNQNNNSKTHHSTTSIIGESIRKLVGKLRSSSSERKNKRRGRSPSPQSSPTYQQYHVIDNNIPDVDSSRSTSRTQGNMERRKVVQRFYLGEDPFGGSIYGREKEYDGVIPARSSRRHHKQDSEESRLHSSSYLSKSTSRLARNDSRAHREPSPVLDYSRTSQTLPRKSQYEKKQVSIQRSSDSSHWDSKLSRSSKPNSSSLINISFVNNVTPSQSSLNRGSSGPAKPARTYKSNLTRSKSFNVHGLDSGDSDLHNSVWKSNPQLHRLNESPPPLKSPGILASISRSQRDLTRSPITDQVDSSFTKTYNSSSILSNGYKTPETTDTKRRLFMKELKEQAPELYKTLHGDEIRTKSSSPVTSTPLRNGNSSRYLDYKSSFRLQDSENERKYPYKSSYMNGTTSPVNYTSGTTSPINNYTRGTTSPVHGTSSPINNFSRSTSSPINYSRGTSSPVNYSTTLNHTPSYKGYDGTTKSIVKKGSLNSDDYSETVRITSKSDDPNRPSVTNTVKSFSKKTIPKNGGVTTETIESSETTTTTKSRFKADKYGLRNGSPGGVVIEVRPSRR